MNTIRHTSILLVLASGMATAPMAGQQVVLAGAPIHQETDFTVAPARITRALLSATEFHAFSGMRATISSAVGGAFTIFDGHIIGRTLEVVPGKRVVQAWRTVDWPQGVWSIVRFELEARDHGSHLVFDQTGFPEAERASLSAGWDSHYWQLLKKYLR